MSEVSPAQRRYIAILCMRNHVREPLEETVANGREAGRAIQVLKARQQGKKKLKPVPVVAPKPVQLKLI